MEIRNSTFDHVCANRTPPNSPRRLPRKENSILHVLSEEQVDIYNEDLALTKVTNPIYISMACFGLVWKSHGKLLVTKRLDLCTLHCIFMLVLIWLNAIHFFLAYDKNDEYGKTLFKKITGHIFALQLASGISTYVYFNHKHIPFFLKQWENYKLSHGGLSLSSMTRHVFNRVVAVNIILLCFYSLYSIFLLLSNREIHMEMLMPISKYIDPSPTWLRVVYTTVHLYIVMAWLQSIIFTGSMWYLLKREFKQLSTQFFKAVHTDQQSVQFARNKSLRQLKALDKVPEGLPRRHNTFEAEQYRKRHMELCKLVARLDKIMSSYLLFLYLYSVPIVVFLLYTLWDYGTDYHKDVTSVLVNIISLIFFVVLLVSVTRAGASLARSVSRLDLYLRCPLPLHNDLRTKLLKEERNQFLLWFP